MPGPEPNATEGWHGHLGARLTLTPSAPACRACAPLPALCPLPELRAEATLPVLPRLLRSPPAQGRGDAVRTLSPLAGQGEHRGVAVPCQSHCHVPAHAPSGGTGRVPAARAHPTCKGFPQHPDLLRGSRRGRSALRRREVGRAHVSPAGPLVVEQRERPSGMRGSACSGSHRCGTG